MTEARIPLWRVMVQLHYRRIIPSGVSVAVSDYVVSELPGIA